MAAIVTGIASLVLSFRGGAAAQKAGILVGGLFALWCLSRTGPVDRALTRAIAWVLRKECIGAPGPDETVSPGDTLVLYGHEGRIAELDRRRGGAEGDAAHAEACHDRMGARSDGSASTLGSAQGRLVQRPAEIGH